MKFNRYLPILSGIILAALCTACQVYPNTININENDNHTEITLEKGDLLIVTLAANPTTGYQWEYISAETPFLEQIGDAEYTPGTDLLGASGVSVFTFNAKETGHGNLHLIYHRTFEEGIAPIKELAVDLQVK